MIDKSNAETEVSVPITVPEKEYVRTPEEQENFNRWDKISAKDIVARVHRLDFIVDHFGFLDSYKGIELPHGWELVTTSRNSNSLGTITLSTSNSRHEQVLKRSIKNYVANHGLRLSQADTFIETLYYAKFAILPLISVVLADKDLYYAYRRYSRNYTVAEYVRWIHDNNLQNSDFNVKLTPAERVHINEMIDRMARADVKLRSVRAAYREKHNITRENPTA